MHLPAPPRIAFEREISCEGGESAHLAGAAVIIRVSATPVARLGGVLGGPVSGPEIPFPGRRRRE